MEFGKPIIDWLTSTFFTNFQSQKNEIAQYFGSNASVFSEDNTKYFGRSSIQDYFNNFPDSTEFIIETSEFQRICKSQNWFLVLISGKKNRVPFNASFCVEIRSSDNKAFIQQISFISNT